MGRPSTGPKKTSSECDRPDSDSGRKPASGLEHELVVYTPPEDLSGNYARAKVVDGASIADVLRDCHERARDTIVWLHCVKDDFRAGRVNAAEMVDGTYELHEREMVLFAELTYLDDSIKRALTSGWRKVAERSNRPPIIDKYGLAASNWHDWVLQCCGRFLEYLTEVNGPAPAQWWSDSSISDLDSNDITPLLELEFDLAAEVAVDEQDGDLLVRVASLYTGGLVAERFAEAADILGQSDLTVDAKLKAMNKLARFPPTTSAKEFAEALGVSAPAVVKTDWWKRNRRGQGEELTGRRQTVHQGRAEDANPHY